MMLHHLRSNRVLFAQKLQLNEEAFSQVPRRNACRVKGLHNFESFADVFHGMAAAAGDLFKRGREITVFVEIANDGNCSVLDACVR